MHTDRQIDTHSTLWRGASQNGQVELSVCTSQPVSVFVGAFEVVATLSDLTVASLPIALRPLLELCAEADKTSLVIKPALPSTWQPLNHGMPLLREKLVMLESRMPILQDPEWRESSSRIAWRQLISNTSEVLTANY